VSAATLQRRALCAGDVITFKRADRIVSAYIMSGVDSDPTACVEAVDLTDPDRSYTVDPAEVIAVTHRHERRVNRGPYRWPEVDRRRGGV
jgi:hypothetical protein